MGTVVASTAHPLSSSGLARAATSTTQAIARLRRWWLRLGWTSPPSPPRAAGLCHDTIAYRMIPPGTWAAASSSLAPALILRDSSFGIRLTRQPPGLHLRDVCHDGFGFLGLRGGIGLGLLLRQLTRMHHHKAERLRGDPSSRCTRPPPGGSTLCPCQCRGASCLRPPWFLHQQGQGGLLLPPGFEFLAHGAGAWD